MRITALFSNKEVIFPIKSHLANYIVRIYRFEQNNPRGLVGVVEEVGVKGKRAFTNLDELWEIFNPPERELVGRKKHDGEEGNSGLEIP